MVHQLLEKIKELHLKPGCQTTLPTFKNTVPSGDEKQFWGSGTLSKGAILKELSGKQGFWLQDIKKKIIQSCGHNLISDFSLPPFSCQVVFHCVDQLFTFTFLAGAFVQSDLH